MNVDYAKFQKKFDSRTISRELSLQINGKHKHFQILKQDLSLLTIYNHFCLKHDKLFLDYLQNTISLVFSPQLLCEHISDPSRLGTGIPYWMAVCHVKKMPNNIPGSALVCGSIHNLINLSTQSLPPFDTNVM